jgi:hypothetical protein
MIRLAFAILEVAVGRAGRIAAPGKWRVWRDDAGLHVEVKL